MPDYLAIYRLVLLLIDDSRFRPLAFQADMSLDYLWKRMAFCILSSNVRYETAQKAFQTLFADQASVWVSADPATVEANVQHALRLSGYRYPAIRAFQLAASWATLRKRYSDLVALFICEQDSAAIREFIVGEFSGIGFKQASMFLRDIGAATDLAILDTHTISFMNALLGTRIKVASRRSYLTAEQCFLEMAEAHGVRVSVLDTAIWAASKVSRERRQGRC